MSTACLMITTDLPHRTEMTLRAMRDVFAAGELKVDKYILSIDLQPDLNGHSARPILVPAAHELGFKVVTGECTGHRAMINNIQRGLALVDEDTLLYCEDHVFVERIMPRDISDFLFTQTPVRWICYNTHVHQENLLNVPGFIESADRPQRFAFINDKQNWHEIGGEEFMVKGPKIRDEYYLNFPVAMVPTEVFTSLMNYGMQHYHDIGIEIGFTNAWFDLQYDRSQQVAIYVKPGTKMFRPFASFQQMHSNACMRFRNNDESMIHPSVVPHALVPQQSNQKRSFF